LKTSNRRAGAGGAAAQPPADRQPAEATAPETLIALGEIVNTHGIGGEMRVRLFNPQSVALGPAAPIVLRRGAWRLEPHILGARRHKQFALVRFAGCDSIEAAKQFIGCEVCVREQDLPPAAANEVYHYQLVGMQVITTGGEVIGTICEVLSVSSSDVCVVRSGAREHLIPLIADVVKEVDRDARRLVIDPTPGLLDT
jgi:16S rRNA processing protein RimM